MPRGVCSGCGAEEFLPPFGDGMCFLCATDGPPDSRQPTGGALDEDADARRDEEPDAYDERQRDILEEFAALQSRWSSAARWAHHRAQRHATWTRTARRDRSRDRGPFGPTVEELEARMARRRVAETRAAARKAEQAEVEFRSAAPAIYAKRVQAVRERRHGAGRYVDEHIVARARQLRDSGLSIRAIARQTGLARQTIQRYVAWISQSDALRYMHARFKAEGRPVLPPWQRGRHP